MEALQCLGIVFLSHHMLKLFPYLQINVFIELAWHNRLIKVLFYIAAYLHVSI